MNAINFNTIGLFLAILNSLADSTYLALAGIVSVNPSFILFARALAHILGSCLVFSLFWTNDIVQGVKDNYKLLSFRALINGITISLKAICVQYMSVADISIISQTTPVFVCIIALIFLNEQLTPIDIIIVAFCFVGVFLVLQPTSSDTGRWKSTYFIAAGFMLFGSLVNAATTVMLKKLASANVHFAVIMCSSGVSILAYGVIGFVILDKTGQIQPGDKCIHSHTTSILVLLAACLGYSAQYTNILTLKLIKASVKSVLCNTINVFLGFLFTITLTPEKANLNGWKIFGAIMVLVSGFLLYAKKEGKFASAKSVSSSKKTNESKKVNYDEKALMSESSADTDE